MPILPLRHISLILFILSADHHDVEQIIGIQKTNLCNFFSNAKGCFVEIARVGINDEYISEIPNSVQPFVRE
jgi:hypothetical protein